MDDPSIPDRPGLGVKTTRPDRPELGVKTRREILYRLVTNIVFPVCFFFEIFGNLLKMVREQFI